MFKERPLFELPKSSDKEKNLIKADIKPKKVKKAKSDNKKCNEIIKPYLGRPLF